MTPALFLAGDEVCELVPHSMMVGDGDPGECKTMQD
jgi:hypothetical protein